MCVRRQQRKILPDAHHYAEYRDDHAPIIKAFS
jgi:hypothetical protein